MSESILLTTTANCQKSTVTMYDYNSCNVLQIYKNGGIAATKTLTQLSDDYILIAEQNKPLLHLWPINSQEPIKNARLVAPDVITASAICPNNCYLVTGIDNKIYTWELSSGTLLSVQQKHYQKISCIKFSSDGDFLVVCGEDGMMVTYNFTNLICVENNYLTQCNIGQAECLYTKTDHSQPITDMHIGCFNFNSRIATVSRDQTCRLYVLVTGVQLLVLVFNEALTSIVFDSACWNLFCGTDSGVIQLFNLLKPPITTPYYINEEDKIKNSFIGHQKKINCLCLNKTNDNLISGSNDCFVFIWEIESKQIIKKIEHQAAVLNVKFNWKYFNIDVQNFKSKIVISGLKRDLNPDRKDMIVSTFQCEDFKWDDETIDEDDIDNYKAEIANCKAINHQLYHKLLNECNKQNKI